MDINLTLEDALKRCPTKSLREKVEASVKLLRKAERLALAYDKEDGYFLAFSGGKDSQVLFHIAQLAEVKFKAHMNLTSIDPPEVIRFVRKEYPDVDMIKPSDSIFHIAAERKILPTMRVRWCCAEYKETAGAGKVTLIGIRKSESTRRSMRNEVEVNSRKFSGTLEELDAFREKRNKRKSSKAITIVNATGERMLGCIHGKESLLISPIIYWTEDDVWEFLNKVVRVPHCELYDKGFKRIGCILCPMSSQKQKQIEIAKYHHVKKNWIKDINRRIYLVEHQSEHAPNRETSWKTFLPIVPKKHPQKFLEGSSSNRLNDELENEIAENIFDWWISGKSYKKWYADKFLQLKIDFGDSVSTEKHQTDCNK